MRKQICSAALVLIGALTTSGHGAVIWNNGQYYTSLTGGYNGNPLSLFSSGGYDLIMTHDPDNEMADNFTIPANTVADLDSLTIYAGQTNATSSPISDLYINIYNTNPSTGAAPLESVSFSGISGSGTLAGYRGTSGSDKNHPFYAYTVSLNALPSSGKLQAGQYWLGVSANALNGNATWVPLVSPTPSDANALQKLVGTWAVANDSGSNAAFPFELDGSVTSTPEPVSGGVLMTLGMLAVRRRRR